MSIRAVENFELGNLGLDLAGLGELKVGCAKLDMDAFDTDLEALDVFRVNLGAVGLDGKLAVAIRWLAQGMLHGELTFSISSSM